MRKLEFNVEGQRLRRTPGCDFSCIVAGTVGYLQMQFHFSKEWDDCIKVVSFWLGDEEIPIKLNDDNLCEIAPEVASHEMFDISVTGGKTGYRIVTNKYHMKQEVR